MGGSECQKCGRGIKIGSSGNSRFNQCQECGQAFCSKCCNEGSFSGKGKCPSCGGTTRRR